VTANADYGRVIATDESWVCPHCGCVESVETAFCWRCGEPQDSLIDAPRCPHCDRVMSEWERKQRVCNECLPDYPPAWLEPEKWSPSQWVQWRSGASPNGRSEP
jgi:hypothetical protein